VTLKRWSSLIKRNFFESIPFQAVFPDLKRFLRL
jgi:hypothetical protein